MELNFSLRNGIKIPPIFIGTNGLEYDTLLAVCNAAMKTGFFAFDTAPNDVSEQYLGKVLRKIMETSDYKREDFFIQTKLDWKDQKNNTIWEAFKKSLDVLGIEYVDSYLMHWPYPETYIKDWKTMEKFYNDGLAKSIGVCNFRERHWKNFMDSNPQIVPHVSQIEIHPFRTCEELVRYHQILGVVTQAYTPLLKMQPKLRDNETLKKMALKYNTTVPHLVLKWHINRGIVPITKSSKPHRVLDNMKCLGIDISNEDMKIIGNLNEDYKFMLESWGCPGF